jgi:hypothetical protein
MTTNPSSPSSAPALPPCAGVEFAAPAASVHHVEFPLNRHWRGSEPLKSQAVGGSHLNHEFSGDAHFENTLKKPFARAAAFCPKYSANNTPAVEGMNPDLLTTGGSLNDAVQVGEIGSRRRDATSCQSRKQARAQAKLRHLRALMASPDWRASAWLLERLWPKEFGRRTMLPKAHLTPKGGARS